MISASLKPKNKKPSNDDFTIDHYAKLIQLASKNYKTTNYNNIQWDEKFLLWRHDIDFSLNRGVALAKIEKEANFVATYFLNPHSSFYNIFELDQTHKIREIISYGHDIGLHFDSAYYNIKSEKELSSLVKNEADILYNVFGKYPVAFSFHNPLEDHLSCDEYEYGGLVNCYSKEFKAKVSYCSDSNGYWRFNRLYDMLSNADERCLQVLTHPVWWQKKPMFPRDRVQRSIYSRARNNLLDYDKLLLDHKRENIRGDSVHFEFLKVYNIDKFYLIDYLWFSGEYSSLHFEALLLFFSQIRNLIKVELQYSQKFSLKEINIIFNKIQNRSQYFELFNIVFKKSISEFSPDKKNFRDKIFFEDNICLSSQINLKKKCIYFFKTIKNITVWSLKSSYGISGLEPQISRIRFNESNRKLKISKNQIYNLLNIKI